MKPYSSRNVSSPSYAKRGAVLCGVALAAGIFAFRAQADDWDKKTILTVNQPIQITDTYLDPGTYVLKLDRSPSDRHIVRIYNAQENHLYNTVLAIPNYRLRPTSNSQFTFWETPAGSPRALRAWFWPGDNFGQEFPYPKHLRQLAVAVPAQAPPAPPPPAPPAPAPEVKVEPAPQEPVAETQPQQEQPVEVAQNTPPPAPPAPPAETAPATPSNDQLNTAPPSELPKTASPYPLAGLAGFFTLALYGLLRVRRDA
jgi:hypothetical protein